MTEFSNRIRRIINKNKKYVIKLKVEQTVKYGTNIYEIRELSEQLAIDEAEQNAPQPVPVAFP